MYDPKSTDQRQAATIAQAVIDRCDELGGHEFAREGQELLAAPKIDYVALLDWNRRACAWLAENWKR
jgi:hypothetical protein